MNKVWHKGLPFSPEVAPYLRRMAGVEDHREALLRLQGVWDSLALLGQMSGTATDIAQTRTAFHDLTTTLLDSLARRLRANALARLQGKARVTIDILVRNLFERTADVGFLAVDGPLCAHAALDAGDTAAADSRAALQARFKAYTANYSVYDDVIVLSPRGEVLARQDDSIALPACDEPWIAAALASDAPYVERYGPTALLGGRPGLIYARALKAPHGNDVIGLLCLSFRLADEMAAVFRQLLAGPDAAHAVICLLDADQHVLQSSDAWQIPPGAVLPVQGERVTFAGRGYLCAAAGASGYEGYMGPPGWQACVLVPLEWAFEAEDDGAMNDELRALGEALDTRRLFDAELQDIPQEARRIQRNLSRTLWNGKLRSHAQAGAGTGSAGFATTLLNEVQRTGAQLREVFEQAIARLQQSALGAVFDGALFQARLAIDIMDRNLYERANDCRWWALDVRLQCALAAQGTPQAAAAAAAEATQVLQHINSLYTVYSLLLVFDLQGRVVAMSDPAQAHHVGHTLTGAWVNSALNLRDPERYVVSHHEASPLYDAGQPTYVYATSLQHAGQVVGGIAIVFDGAPQFAAMLRDSLPARTGDDDMAPRGLFVTRDGRVVASSDDRWPAGSPSPLPAGWATALAAGETRRTELDIGGQVYAAGIAMSQGYREYRRGQPPSGEDVAAVLLQPLGPRLQTTGNDTDAGFTPPPAQPGDETLDIAAFSVAGEWLGLPAALLVEALDTPRLTALPNAPQSLVGMLQHEGRMLPVLDLSLALYGRAADAQDAPILVCRNERGQGLALRVQALGPVFSIAASQALPGPGGRVRLVRGGGASAQHMLTLLAAEDIWAHIGITAPRDQPAALPAP